MTSFFSDALGASHEYRGWFSDNVRCVFLAHANSPGDLACRVAGQSGDYAKTYHAANQVKQVMLDMDKADVEHGAIKSAKAHHGEPEQQLRRDRRKK